MDLHTRYLGLDLRNPLIVGAGPLTDDPDTARKLEDAGAAALVMPSLFEEELDAAALKRREDPADDPHKLPGLSAADRAKLRTTPERYFDRVFQIRHAVDIPVIASINGVTPGGWLRIAQRCEEAGCSAVELNFYKVSTETHETGEDIEREMVAMVTQLRKELTVPLAVKLSPFFTALPNLAAHLARAGVEGLVLFNRFYQPELDWPSLSLRRALRPSGVSDLNLRLRWAAILSSRLPKVDLCVTGGVASGTDAARAVACGACAVQVVGPVLEHGPGYVGTLRGQLEAALREAGAASVEALLGRVSLSAVERTEPFVRANYFASLREEARRVRAGLPLGASSATGPDRQPPRGGRA